MRQTSSWLPLQPLVRRDGLEPGRRPGNGLVAAQCRLPVRSTRVLVRSTGPLVRNTGPLGHIRIERENVSCYAPFATIATMILVSLLLTVPLNIVIRFLNQ